MIANRNGTGEPITPAQSRVIEYLAHRDKVTKGDLAGCLRVSAPAITKLVRTLKRKGLVQQEEDSGDRRRVLVRLSNTGRDLALSMNLTSGIVEKGEEACRNEAATKTSRSFNSSDREDVASGRSLSKREVEP